MPAENRPRRTRFLGAILLLLGRFISDGIQANDTDMITLCQGVMKLVGPTDEMYQTPEGSWTPEQQDVHDTATAFVDAFDDGEWPDVTTLAGLAGDWENAVKSL